MKFLCSSHLAIWALTVLMICGILFFGLRPKSGETANTVKWLPGKKVLQFNGSGIAYIDDEKIIRRLGNSDIYTLELYVAVYGTEKKGFRPILMFHNGSDKDQLVIWQWGSSIIAMNGDDYAYTKQLPRVSARNVLIPGELTLITITASSQQTKIHVNGELASALEGWMLRIPTGKRNDHLVLGNSVDGGHGWNGVVRGMAIYGGTLTPKETKLSYKNWLSDTPTKWATNKEILLCLDFARPPDHSRVDQAVNEQVLRIPTSMVALQPSILKVNLNQLTFSQWFLLDVVLNIIGFLPLGMLFCIGLKQTASLSPANALLWAVIFCFSLSLAIEVTQAWMPSRSSSYIDLICNTLGGCLGGMLGKYSHWLVDFVSTSAGRKN